MNVERLMVSACIASVILCAVGLRRHVVVVEKPVEKPVEKIIEKPVYLHGCKPNPEADEHERDIAIALRNMERGRSICVKHHHEMKWYLHCYGNGNFEGVENEHYTRLGEHKDKDSGNPCEAEAIVCDKWEKKG